MVTKTKKLSKKKAAKAPTTLSAEIRAAGKKLRLTPNETLQRVLAAYKNLARLGTAVTDKNGVITVYADRPLAFTVEKEHVKRAKRKNPKMCTVALAVQNSTIGKYISDVHVGNSLVTAWSNLCPNLRVKYHLDADLKKAVRAWDEEGKWIIEYEICWLGSFPPSLRHGYIKKTYIGPVGPKTRKPTRTVRLKASIESSLKALGPQPAAKKSFTR